ncbi:MAG: hypothetical protein K2K63_15325 [Acetatifactor sp.]|nr:hypothetical protein [Acetatifactor sp.]
MDILDPNTWTKDFAVEHYNECIHSLWEASELVIRYIRQQNYKMALTGLDRILNGLTIIHNSSYGDFRSELFAFSMIEGTIIASCLEEAPENKCREAAIAMFSDARDFATNTYAKQEMEAVISELKRGMPLSEMRANYNENEIIFMLQDLSSRLKEYELSKKSDGSGSGDLGNSRGCYVATAVYGSYDCPQVWTLRRYRDDILASTQHGRILIRAYYAVSPALVKWFGHSLLFRRLWKSRLDKIVKTLNEKGIDNTPYVDRQTD